MAKTLLFLPDISGFTEFVQTTEAQHSQHVIAELLEVMIDSNTIGLELAEVEGDALFFFKEEMPSLEQLLAQIENTFTAFYSHLKLLEKNRVCPCMACTTAPQLQLKIIVHCGDVEFITVQNKRKPFGAEAIEAHRLMKNDVQSDNYILISDALAHEIMLPSHYKSKLYNFQEGQNEYDNKTVKYLYSELDKTNLRLKPFATAQKVNLEGKADLTYEVELYCNAQKGIEWVSNYAKRYEWAEGVDEFIYNEHEVTRLGTEHVCVINGKHLNFVTVTKNDISMSSGLIYGEMTDGPPFVDKVYQFYTFQPINTHRSKIIVEVYLETKSIFKKVFKNLFIKDVFRKGIVKNIDNLSNKTKEIALEG
ncbi:DUF2652 domain-containing protein [Flammeovirga sp. SJP92]|uniref:DUF2652 domain-containing protein n=1 Tax=Flammeovirga sp. SJP92 TaxID=1775430 RepID=UPI0007888FB0|nr:DUF2652 domain-containing protein [Flammeovirga sp. SJP92]KXX69211.1 hypothetical protein AVL50_20250 [Flammeovirga sp. SJP92]